MRGSRLASAPRNDRHSLYFVDRTCGETATLKGVHDAFESDQCLSGALQMELPQVPTDISCRTRFLSSATMATRCSMTINAIFTRSCASHRLTPTRGSCGPAASSTRI